MRALIIDMKDLTLEEEPLAHGTSGQIYKGWYHGVTVAAKVVYSQMMDELQQQ